MFQKIFMFNGKILKLKGFLEELGDYWSDKTATPIVESLKIVNEMQEIVNEICEEHERQERIIESLKNMSERRFE